MERMGKRRKQIITQFAVDMLFLTSGIVVGIVAMLVVGFLAV